MVLNTRPGLNEETRKSLINSWKRKELASEIIASHRKWEEYRFTPMHYCRGHSVQENPIKREMGLVRDIRKSVFGRDNDTQMGRVYLVQKLHGNIKLTFKSVFHRMYPGGRRGYTIKVEPCRKPVFVIKNPDRWNHDILDVSIPTSWKRKVFSKFYKNMDDFSHKNLISYADRATALDDPDKFHDFDIYRGEWWHLPKAKKVTGFIAVYRRGGNLVVFADNMKLLQSRARIATSKLVDKELGV